MPLPHELLIHIHKLEGALNRGENRLLKRPGDINALALVESNRKLLLKYRADFDAMAAQQKEEVLKYTVYAGRGEIPHVRDIAAIFTSFETAVLLTAQSKLLDQPQHRRHLEAPVRAAAFRYGYLFSERDRQLGLVTATNMPAQQLELNSTLVREDLEPGHPERFKNLTPGLLRESAGEIFSVARAAMKPKDIAGFARKYGSAVVVELNEWSELHARTFLDAEAEWHSSDQPELHLNAPATLLDSLHFAIEKLSDEQRFETIKLKGQFYALNLRTRYFSFETMDGTTKIHGTFPKEMLNERKPMKVPRKYEAVFLVKRRFNEALGKDLTTYEIKSIEEL